MAADHKGVAVERSRFCRQDRFTERRAFRGDPVPEYWIVDGDVETFEVWRPDDERAALPADRLTWSPDGRATPFDLDMKAFFASIADGARLRRR